MASRTKLITVSFIDNDESEPIFQEGALDVGFDGGELDKFFTNYKNDYEGLDAIKDALFDTLIVDVVGRFCEKYGTDSSKAIFEKIVNLIKEEIKE